MNTSLALTSCTVAVMLIGNLVVMADRSQREKETEHQPVANEVANKVTNTVSNTVSNIVTETEVYKMACTVDGESYCKEYSVRKINRE